MEIRLSLLNVIKLHRLACMTEENRFVFEKRWIQIPGMQAATITLPALSLSGRTSSAVGQGSCFGSYAAQREPRTWLRIVSISQAHTEIPRDYRVRDFYFYVARLP